MGHYDESQVSAAFDQLVERCAADQKLPGSQGAQARLSQAVMRHVGMAIAREANRSTNGRDLLEAVAALMSNIGLSFALTVTPLDAPPELRAAVINELLGALAECLEHGLVGPPDRTAHVTATEGGHA